jgi:DNA-binding NarL/FixJ family response regulator
MNQRRSQSNKKPVTLSANVPEAGSAAGDDYTSNDHIRVVIVDSHHLIRLGLHCLIETQVDMKVVGEAANREEALHLARSLKPDLIVLDLNFGEENGIDILSALREAAPETRVLVLTGIKDAAVHRQAAKFGAAGVILKEQPVELLLKAMKKVHLGELWLDRSLTGSLFDELTQQDKRIDPDEVKKANLTARELEIVELIAEGLNNKQIGARLFISETTVTHHLSSIFGKLGVSDRLELVIYAFANSLAKMPQKSRGE